MEVSIISKFLTKLKVIPHSTYFESMFSHINNIKILSRNKHEVGSVGSIMKVKSYYLDYEGQNNHDNKGNIEEKDSFFEPSEEHYKLYKLYIKDE